MPETLEAEVQEKEAPTTFKQGREKEKRGARLVYFCKRQIDETLRLVAKQGSRCEQCLPDFIAESLDSYIPNSQCPHYIPYLGVRTPHVFEVVG